ncbi:MAG: sugar phosphate isomerase/epimerase family protein [Gammaproteobacteria bacterium]
MQNIQISITPQHCNQGLPVDHTSEVSFESCIEDIKKANFDGCEIGYNFPRDPYSLHAALKPLGLKISSAPFSSYFANKETVTDSINRFIDHMHFLNAMNASIITVSECTDNTFEAKKPITTKDPILTTAQWNLFIENLNRIGALARENNMYVAYQPLASTGVKTQQDIDKLMQKTDEDSVFLLIDTGHLFLQNIDIVKLIKKHHHRIKYIHLKDIDKKVLAEVKKKKLNYHDAIQAGLFTSPGQGDINFDPIFDIIKKINYEGWLVIDSEKTCIGKPAKKGASPVTNAKNARKFLKMKLGF